MADIRLQDYARQPSSPRVEVHPSLDFIQVEYAVANGSHAHLYQRTKSTSSPISTSIQVAVHSYMTWCLMVDYPLTMFLEIEGDDFSVLGGFLDYKAFPLFPIIVNDLTRLYVPAFLARLTVYNNSGYAANVTGIVKLEGI
jgi:hypothetical protein